MSNVKDRKNAKRSSLTKPKCPNAMPIIIVPNALFHPSFPLLQVSRESLCGVVGNESRVASDAANLLVADLEFPWALVGIGESGIAVLTTEDNDRAALLVENGAAELWVDEGTEAQLDGVEGAGATDWGLGGRDEGVVEDGLSRELAGAGEDDGGYEVVGGDGLDGWVADDGVDFRVWVLESPCALV